MNDITREQLLEKINTLDNYYVCDGVLEEIDYLHKEEGKSYDEIWKHFRILDELAEEEREYE